MKVPLNILLYAKEAARKSVGRFRLGAVIFKKNAIISSGYNKPGKTSPKSPAPFKSLHAEFDAIVGNSRDSIRGASIYVHRLKRNGNPGLAKPCQYCAGMLLGLGIKKILYSENG